MVLLVVHESISSLESWKIIFNYQKESVHTLMTRKKKSSIVKKQWSHQTKQYIQKNIVVTSQAKLALEELLSHLNATVTHSYLKSVVMKPYWIELQMTLILPYANDHPILSALM